MIEIDGVQIVMNSEVELSLRQEIMEKVSFILSVLKGTIPMNREVGIDPMLYRRRPTRPRTFIPFRRSKLSKNSKTAFRSMKSGSKQMETEI